MDTCEQKTLLKKLIQRITILECKYDKLLDKLNKLVMVVGKSDD